MGATNAGPPNVSTVAVSDIPDNTGLDAGHSEGILMSEGAAALRPVLAWSGAQRAVNSGVAPGTDDDADVLSALVRGLRR